MTHLDAFSNVCIVSLGSCVCLSRVNNVCVLFNSHGVHPSGHTGCTLGPPSEYKPGRQVKIQFNLFTGGIQNHGYSVDTVCCKHHLFFDLFCFFNLQYSCRAKVDNFKTAPFHRLNRTPNYKSTELCV